MDEASLSTATSLCRQLLSSLETLRRGAPPLSDAQPPSTEGEGAGGATFSSSSSSSSSSAPRAEIFAPPLGVANASSDEGALQYRARLPPTLAPTHASSFASRSPTASHFNAIATTLGPRGGGIHSPTLAQSPSRHGSGSAPAALSASMMRSRPRPRALDSAALLPPSSSSTSFATAAPPSSSSLFAPGASGASRGGGALFSTSASGQFASMTETRGGAHAAAAVGGVGSNSSSSGGGGNLLRAADRPLFATPLRGVGGSQSPLRATATYSSSATFAPAAPPPTLPLQQEQQTLSPARRVAATAVEAASERLYALDSAVLNAMSLAAASTASIASFAGSSSGSSSSSSSFFSSSSAPPGDAGLPSFASFGGGSNGGTLASSAGNGVAAPSSSSFKTSFSSFPSSAAPPGAESRGGLSASGFFPGAFGPATAAAPSSVLQARPSPQLAPHRSSYVSFDQPASQSAADIEAYRKRNEAASALHSALARLDSFSGGLGSATPPSALSTESSGSFTSGGGSLGLSPSRGQHLPRPGNGGSGSGGGIPHFVSAAIGAGVRSSVDGGSLPLLHRIGASGNGVSLEQATSEQSNEAIMSLLEALKKL